MVYDKARELAKLLENSEEYTAYKQSKEKAMQNETNAALLKEFKNLQLQVQAMSVAGKQDAELNEKMQKMAEVLQFNPDAAEFLQAEFMFNRMLSDVFRILAEAVKIDLGYEQ